MQKILVKKLIIIIKRYESIPLNRETVLYFWYNIIIYHDEATDSSVYSGPVFIISYKHVVLRR